MLCGVELYLTCALRSDGGGPTRSFTRETSIYVCLR